MLWFELEDEEGHNLYILYDTLHLQNLLQFPKLKYVIMGSNLDNLMLDYQVIVGVIEIQKSDNCKPYSVVRASAAEKGFGPLMYEIALSSGIAGLIPDNNGTSASARNVWRKFYEREDVEVIDIPEGDCEAYKSHVVKNTKDRTFIPKAIKLKNPIDYSGLEARHQEIRTMLREPLEPSGMRISGHSVEVNLHLAADKFFKRKNV